jgi:hypothetical protein
MRGHPVNPSTVVMQMYVRIDLVWVYLWLGRATVGGGSGSELMLAWWRVDESLMVSFMSIDSRS